MKKLIYISIVIFVLNSCKSDKKTDQEFQNEANLQEDVRISSIETTLLPKAKQDITDWLSFQMVQSKMNGYYKVTKSQALQNARELADLIKNASDTIKVDKLNRPDVLIRFNVLRNHALRLDDMSTIPNISEQEVMDEVDDLLNAYSSIYEKINVIYKIEEYENQLDLDDEKNTKIYTKKSLSNKKEINDNKNKKLRPKIPLKTQQKKKGVLPLKKGKLKTTKKS